MLDGCSNIRFILTILMPLTKSGIGAMVVYTFINAWNMYMWPLLVNGSNEMRTVQIGISMLNSIDAQSITMMIAGVVMIMAAKSNKRKNVGAVLIGFAILMFGMEVMTEAMSPLADMPEFTHVLTAFANPILGVIVGTIVTAVIQSSAASIGILQALSMVGGITYGMAIPIVMGQNIGTCISAVLSSIGVNTNLSLIHI